MKKIAMVIDRTISPPEFENEDGKRYIRISSRGQHLKGFVLFIPYWLGTSSEHIWVMKSPDKNALCLSPGPRGAGLAYVFPDKEEALVERRRHRGAIVTISMGDGEIYAAKEDLEIGQSFFERVDGSEMRELWYATLNLDC